MGTVKSLAADVMNLWLSYVTSQPVNFDLPVIATFVSQYFGADVITSARARSQKPPTL